MNPNESFRSPEIEEAKRVAYFCARIHPAFESIERETYGCAANEADAEAFIQGAIEDARRELASGFGVAPLSLVLSVTDHTPLVFPYNPALIRAWASRNGRERWCEIQLWSREPNLDGFQRRVARVLRRYPVHRERLWTKIKRRLPWHANR